MPQTLHRTTGTGPVAIGRSQVYALWEYQHEEAEGGRPAHRRWVVRVSLDEADNLGLCPVPVGPLAVAGPAGDAGPLSRRPGRPAIRAVDVRTLSGPAEEVAQVPPQLFVRRLGHVHHVSGLVIGRRDVPTQRRVQPEVGDRVIGRRKRRRQVVIPVGDEDPQVVFFVIAERRIGPTLT